MYRKASKGLFKHYDFLLLDLICLQLTFVLACIIRQGWGNPYAVPVYRNIGVFICLADILVLLCMETLKNVIKRGFYREMTATVKHAVAIMLLLALYLFMVQSEYHYSRIVFLLMGVLYVILTYCTRIWWKYILRKRMKDGGRRSLLLVTTEDMAEDIVKDILENNYEMFSVAGLSILDRDMTGEEIAGIPVVASGSTAADYICREWVDEVFIILHRNYDYPQKMLDQFVETGVTVHINLAQVSQVSGKKQFVERIGNYTVLTTSINYMRLKQALLKRLLDIAGGLAGCFFTAIIFVFVAPAIYISSPGPIFFTQIRVGQNGKKFKMYKFRSMYMDAEERKQELMGKNRVDDGLMFKLDFDPRVIGNRILPNGKKKTGIGNFIRVTSLDEFPQFFNVLKGDMSLVGPRDIIGTTKNNLCFSMV
ncbi:MAG: sugar transferase [Ruminococcus sp.]|jgi:lipopolysaccharide/colanic/teichoic acid biosynthesis glycosyltransferase